MLITEAQAKAIRRKQIDNRLTKKSAAEAIGVNFTTYQKLFNGGKVQKRVYQKAMDWLLEDY